MIASPELKHTQYMYNVVNLRICLHTVLCVIIGCTSRNTRPASNRCIRIFPICTF